MSKENDDLNQRRRLYMILLYPDSKDYDYNNALRVLKSNKYYAYNTHLPDNDDKKTHVHFYLKLDNACTPSALEKKTGIPVRFLGKKVKSERSCIRYLIHKDDEDKIQYKKQDCIVSIPFQRFFNKAFDDLKTDTEIIEDIYKYIGDLASEGLLNISVKRKLITYVTENCYDDIYKRFRYEINEYINQLCIYNT